MRRRDILRGIGVGGFVLAADGWVGQAIRRAEGQEEPLRLVVIHRPNGTVIGQWLNGTTPGSIVQPFMPYAPRVLSGMRLETSPHMDGGSHEAAMVTLATGAPIGEPRFADNYRNTAISVDHRLATESPTLSATRIRKMGLAAHLEQEGGKEVANYTLSYGGPTVPGGPERAEEPTTSPLDAYRSLFPSLMPGGDSDEARLALERTRRRRGSVLDFVRGDLARARGIAPIEARPQLDAQEGAIRDLELALDELQTGGGACGPTAEPGGAVVGHRHDDVARVAAAHFALIRTAFVCDVTRLMTFMWSVAASRVDFSGLAGAEVDNHHALSHGDPQGSRMVAIDRWYAERTAEFVASLAAEPDAAGGTLLDRTLVVHFSEVQHSNAHSYDRLPVVLFGGAQTRLRPGPVIDVAGRTTNDLWLTLARRFGAPITSLGDEAQWSGPIDQLIPA